MAFKPASYDAIACKNKKHSMNISVVPTETCAHACMVRKLIRGFMAR